MTRAFGVAWLLLALAWGASGLTVRAQSGVTDLAGRSVTPLVGSAAATVLIFTAVECPISDRYAPAVRRLAERYGAAGVRFWLVYPNEGETSAAVKTHAEAFSYGLPVVLDTARSLTDLAAATVTPEAAVFDSAGRLRYHGRIDDRYVDFGVERPTPTRHDLEAALGAVLGGRAVTPPATRAVGCAIVRHRP